ncbi:MAG TPA: FecR domain-containing protein, partial [Chitinophagaceae bacterium]|nr:FecR domain-containing protein [Chitinophagaceae bacterium]
ATENNVNLIKKADCEIVYDDSRLTAHDSPLTYNTLTNPRGSKVIDMTLSDGSKVWLNAGSSVKYPVTFIGKDRKVEITGEAYFEVTHDPGRPFVVSKGLISVTVLGTHFNVNAYDDEADIKVTLLEGSVKVSELTTHHSQLIKPGEQGIAMNNGELTVKNDVDMEQVMAWKNGRFQFNEADLQTVLRQVARWYDVEIVYEGDVPTRQFGGKMQKELNLSEILKILEKNNVHFRIDGKKLIVLK